jgi:hypothetical protein
MLTTIAAAVAQNVILGWLWRRAQEIAGLAFAFIPIYLAMPPAMQQDVQAIFTGQGGGLTISAAFGILWYLWTQWQSYRATVAPQVVTGEGKKIPIKPNTRAASAIEAEAIAAPKPKTLWERLTQR